MRALLLVLLLATLDCVASPGGPRIVHLDRPGMLEAIQRENPAHYRKLVEALRIAGHHSCEMALQLYKVQSAVRDANCDRMQILTSLPPKRRVAFTLDDTRYLAVVTLRDLEGRIVPAK